jgi:hypothetical protein
VGLQSGFFSSWYKMTLARCFSNHGRTLPRDNHRVTETFGHLLPISLTSFICRRKYPIRAVRALQFHCNCIAISLQCNCILIAISLQFHCIFIAFHCISLQFHCNFIAISLQFHCNFIAFHCNFIAISLQLQE